MNLEQHITQILMIPKIPQHTYYELVAMTAPLKQLGTVINYSLN